MPSHPPLWNQFKARAQKLKKDTGNVLFIILLAVALFAALAYAVTQSTRSGGGDASKESANLTAARISQYNTAIKNAVMRVRLNGCDETQISFENPLMTGYVNPNAPVNYSCHIFRPEGGGVVFQTPQQLTGEISSAYYFTGNMGARADVNRFSWPTSRPPLLMQIAINNEQVCRAIARSADQQVDPNACGEANRPNNTVGAQLFVGSYSPGTYAFPDNPQCGTGYTLGETFCIQNTSGGYYIFHILIAR